jgi:iron complex transport system substrate-binding protein
LAGRIAAAVTVAIACSGGPAGAEPFPRRIVSINLCTDELLMGLAAPSQIAAVSLVASNPTLSAMVAEARRYPAITGAAEEVLKLTPDLVVAGTFSRRDTRDVLARLGYRLETFDPVISVDGARDEIRRVGSMIGASDRAAALSTRIDDALARARGAGRGLSVLALERRGFVSGQGTLIADLLAHMDAENAADRLGAVSVAQVTTEAILKARPNALILDERITQAHDQGTALLLHPALKEIVPATARVVLPGQLITCAGPTLPQAIDSLSAGLRAIPRSASVAR